MKPLLSKNLRNIVLFPLTAVVFDTEKNGHLYDRKSVVLQRSVVLI